MAKWIKFSDRTPTEADTDTKGNLMVRCDKHGYWYMRHIKVIKQNLSFYDKRGLSWLEGIPPLPKPRTLEDVVREYLGGSDEECLLYREDNRRLRKEMREILEEKDNG